MDIFQGKGESMLLGGTNDGREVVESHVSKDIRFMNCVIYKLEREHEVHLPAVRNTDTKECSTHVTVLELGKAGVLP